MRLNKDRILVRYLLDAVSINFREPNESYETKIRQTS